MCGQNSHVVTFSVSCIVVAILCYGMMSMFWCCRLSFATTSPFTILAHVSDLLAFSIASHRRDLHRDIFAERSDLTVEIFLAMATGWDDRGNPGDRHIDDGMKLWIGDLHKDLTE